MRNRTYAAAAILGLAVVATSPAHAYRMIQNTAVGRTSAGYAVACNAAGGFAHWTNGNITWRVNTGGQGAGKEAALAAGLAAWTGVSGANHTLTLNTTPTTAGFATDGQNTVLWAKGNGCSGTCLAITALVLASGQVITETDISFNSRYNWRTDGSDYDTQAVWTHEVGHSLGIHHTELTSTPRPTMYASYFGSTGRTLESDDASALQCAQSRYPVP